jgi:hypothetical protein
LFVLKGVVAHAPDLAAYRVAATAVPSRASSPQPLERADGIFLQKF